MTNDTDLLPARRPPSRLVAGAGLILAILLLTSLLPSGAARAALPSVLIPPSGAYFGARVEPSGGESQEDAVLRAEAQVGRRFAIDHFYYQWTSSFPNSNQTWTVAQGRIPFINWKGSGSWSSIANGSQDAVIRARADAFKAWGSPAYLTFHHEPENDLSRYGSAADYAAAFRRIVDIFRSRGVTNVAFVWTLMAWTFNPRSGRDPLPYYPGDAYVDIVGADGYNWNPGKPGTEWVSFGDIFTDVNAWSAARGKPWMAVEYGVMEDPSQPGRKGQWFRDAIATARTWPGLKALIYFDVFKDYDWRTNSSSTSMSGYRALASDPWLQPGTNPPPPPSPSPPWSPSPSPSSSPSPTWSPSPSPPPPSPSPTWSPIPSPSSSPSPTWSPSPSPPPPSPSPTWSPIPSPSPSAPAPSPSPTWSPSPLPSPSPSPTPSDPPQPSVPALVVTNSLNGGAVQAPVTVGNSGSPTDYAFDDIDLDPGATLAYDDSRAFGPGLSARHAAGPRQNTFYQWDQSLQSSWSIYGRVYVWFDQLPVGDLRLIRGMDPTGLSFAIDLLRSGKLRIKDQGNANIGQTPTSIATGQWVRIEWRADLAAGQVEARIFNIPTSPFPTGFVASATGRAISTSTNQIQVGRSGTQPFSVVFWTDEPAVGVMGWLGPAPV